MINMWIHLIKSSYSVYIDQNKGLHQKKMHRLLFANSKINILSKKMEDSKKIKGEKGTRHLEKKQRIYCLLI